MATTLIKSSIETSLQLSPTYFGNIVAELTKQFGTDVCSIILEYTYPFAPSSLIWFPDDKPPNAYQINGKATFYIPFTFSVSDPCVFGFSVRIEANDYPQENCLKMWVTDKMRSRTLHELRYTDRATTHIFEWTTTTERFESNRIITGTDDVYHETKRFCCKNVDDVYIGIKIGENQTLYFEEFLFYFLDKPE